MISLEFYWIALRKASHAAKSKLCRKKEVIQRKASRVMRESFTARVLSGKVACGILISLIWQPFKGSCVKSDLHEKGVSGDMPANDSWARARDELIRLLIRKGYPAEFGELVAKNLGSEKLMRRKFVPKKKRLRLKPPKML